jgi:hypothetical protein
MESHRDSRRRNMSKLTATLPAVNLVNQEPNQRRLIPSSFYLAWRSIHATETLWTEIKSKTSVSTIKKLVAGKKTHPSQVLFGHPPLTNLITTIFHLSVRSHKGANLPFRFPLVMWEVSLRSQVKYFKFL